MCERVCIDMRKGFLLSILSWLKTCLSDFIRLIKQFVHKIQITCPHRNGKQSTLIICEDLNPRPLSISMQMVTNSRLRLQTHNILLWLRKSRIFTIVILIAKHTNFNLISIELKMLLKAFTMFSWHGALEILFHVFYEVGRDFTGFLSGIFECFLRM